MSDEEFHRRVTDGGSKPGEDDATDIELKTDSLNPLKKWGQAANAHLSGFIGTRRTLLYVTGGVLIYLATFAGLSSLSHGSVGEFIAALEPNGSETLYPVSIANSSIIAGILTVIFIRILIKYELLMFSTKQIAKDLVSLIFAVVIFLNVFYVISWEIIAPIFEMLSVQDLSVDKISFITGVGLVTVWLIIRTHHTFPTRYYLTRRETRKVTKAANNSLNNAEGQIGTEKFDQAMNSVIDARVSLNIAEEILSNEEVVDSNISAQIKNTKEKIQKVGRHLASEAATVGATQLDKQLYEDAYDTLLIADETLDEFNISQSERSPTENSDTAELETRVQTHLQTTRNELRTIAESVEAEIDSYLADADTSRANGRYDHALNLLETASDLAERHQRLNKIGITNKELSSAKKQMQSLTQQIIQERQESDLRSELERYRNSIADIIGIGSTQVDLNLRSNRDLQATVNAYEDLYDTLNTVNRLERNSPEFPWDPFQAELKGVATGERHITLDTLSKYHRVAINADKVLTYLQSAPEAHPSIDIEEWQEAVTVALEEQYPGILDPIVGQIDRLGSELWQRKHLTEITWEEFENLVGELYRSLGFSVEVTQGTADLGIDVWAKQTGERTAIQVKQYNEDNTVGRETLQKLLSTVARGEADQVVVVTSGDFARTAERYAADTPDIQLIDGEELLELLSESEIPPPV